MSNTLDSDQLRRANLPERYWGPDISLKQLPAAPYRDTILAYFTHFDRMMAEGVGLFLWSTANGTGKTSIASIAAKFALLRGLSTFYYRSEELKDASVERRPFDTSTSVLERAKEVQVLVLDDLGKEYKTQSGYAESVIENLLRERVQRMRVTIATSNIKASALSSVFSQDVSEVMKEALIPVEIVGPEKGGKLWREEKKAALRALLKQTED